MSWKINILENNILELEVSGQITHKRAIEQADEIIKLSRELEIFRFLLNIVNLHPENELEISLSEIYILPEYYINRGLPRYSKIALILPKIDYRMDDINFLAGVFMRSGYSFALLKDKDKAIQYLIKEESCDVSGCSIC